MDPHAAYLLLRGLKTLELRVLRWVFVLGSTCSTARLCAGVVGDCLQARAHAQARARKGCVRTHGLLRRMLQPPCQHGRSGAPKPSAAAWLCHGHKARERPQHRSHCVGGPEGACRLRCVHASPACAPRLCLACACAHASYVSSALDGADGLCARTQAQCHRLGDRPPLEQPSQGHACVVPRPGLPPRPRHCSQANEGLWWRGEYERRLCCLWVMSEVNCERHWHMRRGSV